MTAVTEEKDPKKPAEENPRERPGEKPQEATAGSEEEISEEEAEKLPFPAAAVVRIMKANMDNEKMIKKDVKIAMNKWLGQMCARVSREMNRFPYVMMHLNEFNEGKRVYEDLEGFDREKKRILAHFDAMKRDIERLERDLGKVEEDVMSMEKKRE